MAVNWSYKSEAGVVTSTCVRRAQPVVLFESASSIPWRRCQEVLPAFGAARRWRKRGSSLWLGISMLVMGKVVGKDRYLVGVGGCEEGRS